MASGTLIRSGNESAPSSSSIPPSTIAITKANAGTLIQRTSSLAAPILLLTGHEAPVLSVKFSPDGSVLATASADHSILLWHSFAPKPSSFMMLRGHDHAVTEIDFTPAGNTLCSSSLDRTMAIWDLESGTKLRRLKGYESFVNACAANKVNFHMVAGVDDSGLVMVWDDRQRNPVHTLNTNYPLTCVRFAPTGDGLFIGGIDNVISHWDLRHSLSAPSHKYLGHTDTLTGLSVHPEGTHLLSTAMDSTVRIWDIRPFCSAPSRLESTLLGAPHGFDKNLIRPAWSADGSYVACGSGDRSVVIWDTKTKKMVYKLPGHQGTVNEVAWHPKEPVLASGAMDKQVFLGEVNQAAGSTYRV